MAKRKKKGTPIDQVQCPPGIDAVGKREFERLVPELKKLGYLVIDQAALGAYLTHFALWSKAKNAIAKEGLVVPTPKGFLQVSPWHTILRQNSELLKKWTQELGFSPGSRKRIGIDLAEDGPGETLLDG